MSCWVTEKIESFLALYMINLSICSYLHIYYLRIRMSKSLAASDEKERQKERQTKAIWDDVTVDSFINVCITETLNGNRPHGHFTKIGWRNVVKNFHAKTGRNYGYKQLKNKWTTLKKDRQVWNDLIGTDKQLGWDTQRQTIDATSQWWDSKLKVIIIFEFL